MLVLFETPAGYAIFKLLNEKKLKETENLYVDFESPESAAKIVKLKHFEKFADTTEALAAATASVEGKLSKTLKKALKHNVESHEQLIVADSKLGSAIKEKLSLSCLTSSAAQELMRCIRSQLDGLVSGLARKEMAAMALGLAHSLGRYKLKFSPDKVDTMIVQAVNLLDDLDKELNNYVMRCREWYGWHFPELGKLVADNVVFAKVVKVLGTRENASGSDLSDVLPEEVEEKVKEAAEISMGTEVSDDDILNIQNLCDQVIEITNYRAQLYDYLKSRMMAMAPNLTVLVGDLVGARLISHAGSLINLAKHPASTVQILGAEKALFRALKTKKDTPKYGLIYHSQLVGQAGAKNKGKMSRMLAAKASLATRVDALGEGEGGGFELGAEHRAKLEARLRVLEEGGARRVSGSGKAKAKFEKYHGQSQIKQYQDAADSTLPSSAAKRKIEEVVKDEPMDAEAEGGEKKEKQKKKKVKKEKAEAEAEEGEETVAAQATPKKKQKKIKQEDDEKEADQETIEAETEEPTSSKKKKKKKRQDSVKEEVEEEEVVKVEPPTSEKKKKKKKKKSESSE